MLLTSIATERHVVYFFSRSNRIFHLHKPQKRITSSRELSIRLLGISKSGQYHRPLWILSKNVNGLSLTVRHVFPPTKICDICYVLLIKCVQNFLKYGFAYQWKYFRKNYKCFMIYLFSWGKLFAYRTGKKTNKFGEKNYLYRHSGVKVDAVFLWTGLSAHFVSPVFREILVSELQSVCLSNLFVLVYMKCFFFFLFIFIFDLN